jgi:hypothetical protein
MGVCMEAKFSFPTRYDAEQILAWANAQNPGQWVEHSRVTGRAAETIALKCGLDSERAYVSGLLHDIGYYSYRNGKGEKDHIFAGYDLMLSKDYKAIAKICLSHSFIYQDIRTLSSSYITCNEEEMNLITVFLSEVVYDDYDKLIQLCDSLCLPQGVVILEKRIVDVVVRHGFGDFTIEKWKLWFSLKDYFDQLCGMNIYNLFYDEIKSNIFYT